MLKKIEDIHNLELELVKIEGHNHTQSHQNKANNNPLGTAKSIKLSSQRNEEVMAEIRSMLREMVNSESSMNPGTHNITVNKIYEEYSKIINRGGGAENTSVAFNSNELLSATSSPMVTQKFIENVEASDIFRRFNVYKNKIEQEFIYLVNHSKDLELNLNNFDNLDRAIKEIDKYKNLIRLAENNFHKERSYLFKQIDNFLIANNSNSNRVSVNNIKANIEKIITDKHIEFQTIINGLCSSLSFSSSGRRNNSSGGEQAAQNSDSSFLTEEEEAIKKISERIKVLKARIDSKDRVPKVSKRFNGRKNRGKLTGSCENVSDSSSDDTDNKELYHLNEQIRLLKSRMIAKGDQLNMLKKSSNEIFIQQAASVTPAPCPGPVYLPVSFKKQCNNSEFISNNNENYRTYRVEPLELYDDGGHDENFTNENNTMRTPHSANNEQYTAESLNECNEYTKTSYKDIKNPMQATLATTCSNKFFLVNKIGEDEVDCSPNRKYTSSIEIPAEQLESLKCGMKVTKKFRSKSESFSEESRNSEDNEYDMNLAFNNGVSNSKTLKRQSLHKSVISLSNPHRHNQNENRNSLKVSLKSFKYPQPEKQTMTDNIDTVNDKSLVITNSNNNNSNMNENETKNEILEKFQKEVNELKRMLIDKNELINRQHEQQRQLNDLKSSEIMICQQKNENLNKLLENQKLELLNLKNILSKLFILYISCC